MKITGKIITSFFAGALAFGMLGVVGCSSTDSTPQEITTASINAQDIEVTASGYTIMEGNMVNYAFTINNPNDGYIANNVTFTIEAYDEDDLMVIGGGETVSEVYPNIETGVAGTSYMPDQDRVIARFEVKPLMENVLWTKTDMTAEEVDNMFQITDVEVNRNDENAVVATGTVSTEFSDDASSSSSDGDVSYTSRMVNAHAVAILKDASGNILCGGSSNGLILDPSMVPVVGNSSSDAATTDLNDTEYIEPSNTASTTFVISIANAPSYSTCSIIVTPGI